MESRSVFKELSLLDNNVDKITDVVPKAEVRNSRECVKRKSRNGASLKREERDEKESVKQEEERDEKASVKQEEEHDEKASVKQEYERDEKESVKQEEERDEKESVKQGEERDEKESVKQEEGDEKESVKQEDHENGGEEKQEPEEEQDQSEINASTERLEQYRRLNFLLAKSETYTSYVADRMKRQLEEEEKKRVRAEKLKEKKEAPVVAAGEKRSGLRKTAASEQASTNGQRSSPRGAQARSSPRGAQARKRKASNPEPGQKSKKRRINDPGETEVEFIESQDDEDELVARDDHPLFFTGGSLRDYQIEGFRWLQTLYEHGINGILADEMGLGKTIQCIAVISSLCAAGVSGPFLVIGPLSTLPNWTAEFKRFAPRIPVILYHGTKEERLALLGKLRRKHQLSAQYSTFPVLITSYEILIRDRPHLQRFTWRYLIVDEGHRIKNKDCRLIKELKQLSASNRLLLTGTPLQNNLEELWSLLNYIFPEFFDSFIGFESMFDLNKSHESILLEEKHNNVLAKLHQILSPFLLRRIKADIDLNLPPKRELLVYAPLAEEQVTLYRAAINNSIEALVQKEKPKQVDSQPKGRGHRQRKSVDYASMMNESGTADEKSPSKKSKSEADDDEDIDAWCNQFLDEGPKTAVVAKELSTSTTEVHLQLRNKMMLLRKICNHPYLIEYPLTKDGEYKVDEKLVSSCGKLKLFDQMVKELLKRGHKILVFSQMTSLMNILEDFCYLRGLQFSRLDGSMGVTERSEQMESFNTDPDVGLFLLSTRAGGLGINLVAADTCIIFDSDWNPQCDLQAQDRCHRIGQTKPVLVFRLVTAKTIDQEIVERAASKRKLEKMVIAKGRFKSGVKSFTSKMERLDADTLRALLSSVDYDGSLEICSSTNVLSDKELDQLLDRSSLMKQWEAAKKGEKKNEAADEMESGVDGLFKVVKEEEDNDMRAIQG